MSILIRELPTPFITVKQKPQTPLTISSKQMDLISFGGCQEFSVLCRNVDVCTSVICAPSSDVAAMMERNFWKCSHRISNCLSSECILPGSGQIEFFCRKQLQLASRDPTMETTGSSSWVASQIQPLIAEFRPVAYVEFATAFETYIGQTAVNMGRYSALHSALGSIEDTVRGDEQGVVYDDFRAKPEAWKRAGNLVKLLFQTGNVVLSGGWSQ